MSDCPPQIPADLSDPDRWVGIAELSGLGFGSPWTVREYARQGLIPAVKVGGQWRVRIGDLPRPESAEAQAGRTNQNLTDLTEAERRVARRILESLLQTIA